MGLLGQGLRPRLPRICIKPPFFPSAKLFSIWSFSLILIILSRIIFGVLHSTPLKRNSTPNSNLAYRQRIITVENLLTLPHTCCEQVRILLAHARLQFTSRFSLGLMDHITLTDTNVLQLNTSLDLYRYTQRTGFKDKVLLVSQQL